MARRMALRYRHTGEPVDDLFQVASLGLLAAMRRWDPDRGIAFATFAAPTILGELKRYFRDSTWAVKPPRSKQELSLAVARARDELSRGGSHAPAPAEIAGRLGRTQDEVLDALAAAGARRADSLDAPAHDSDDEPVTALELISAPDPGYERVEAEMTFDASVAKLDKRAREVVRLRVGEELLQREIGEMIGVSQMQVSRILRDSMRRLQLADEAA